MRSGSGGPAALLAAVVLMLATACHPARPAVLLGPGAHGPAVRDLQARLAQLDLFTRPPTGRYATETARALRRFQHQAGLPPTGTYTTADRSALNSRTSTPKKPELHPGHVQNTQSVHSTHSTHSTHGSRKHRHVSGRSDN
ncbi:peptidoglycan-binding protein [Streptomyces sp. RS10V-4]|uniref:peptidoglycan-binding domain-containing protein n=1 Tax=Streptomyces rhizoryzae TaxID=2932493 RepID=UPI002004A31D|nr:peptidoglycan-binding domain-containing protein [Streptomyces rhizoryzae]MCK7623018.1 peptidoglycan-binding protein [Streptomyces rhizoryzae]